MMSTSVGSSRSRYRMKAWSAWTVGMDSNTSSISANSSVARPSMATGRRVQVTVGATPRDSRIGRFSASQPTPMSTRRSTRVVSTPPPSRLPHVYPDARDARGRTGMSRLVPGASGPWGLWRIVPVSEKLLPVGSGSPARDLPKQSGQRDNINQGAVAPAGPADLTHAPRDPRLRHHRAPRSTTMRRTASGIAGSIARRARDLVSSDLLGVGTSRGLATDARHSRSSPDVAPKHHRNHPRVAVPSTLTVEQLRSAPFESNALEPCGDDDAATMSRQIRKRRAYPVACAARCRHGFARAYLHAPLHVPAATARGFDRLPGDESAPGPSPGTPNPDEPEPDHDEGRSRRPVVAVDRGDRDPRPRLRSRRRAAGRRRNTRWAGSRARCWTARWTSWSEGGA